MASRRIQSADSGRARSRVPFIQYLRQPRLGKFRELLFALVTVVAYGYAIAKLFQVATGELTTNPPDVGVGLLALLGAGYATYFAYKADSNADSHNVTVQEVCDLPRNSGRRWFVRQHRQRAGTQ